MKAAFTLIPSESRRLIAKAVVEMKEIKTAMDNAYVILNGGTSNGYIAQELFGMNDLEPHKFTAGTNTHRLLCITDADKRSPFPIIYYKGEKSSKTLKEALEDFHKETEVKDWYAKGVCRHCGKTRPQNKSLCYGCASEVRSAVRRRY